MGEETAAEPKPTVTQLPELPHVLAITFPGQGHVNPMLRLAKRLASKGLLVTFTSSTDVGAKIRSANSSSAIVDDAEDSVDVGAGRLRFDFFDDGWSPDDYRSAQLDSFMHHIATAWPKAVADFARAQAELRRPISYIISNPFIPWVLDVAGELNIPAAVLWVQSAAVFSTYYHYYHSLTKFPSEIEPNIAVTIPGIPTMTADEIPSFLLSSNPYKTLTEAILGCFGNLSKSTCLLTNTFTELERDAINGVPAELSCEIIPVGPLIELEEEKSSDIRADLWKAEDCMGWLDLQANRSVVYVSVGSIVVLTKEDMEELAAGLIASCRPFIWVVRDDIRHLLPQQFTDHLKVNNNLGLVLPWGPQDKVLAHAAVACFVSHCGWNSTLEALSAAVPVVAYPQWGDQVTDGKFIEEVYGVGMRLKKPLEREDLARCVEEASTSEKIRAAAEKWSAAARAATKGGGSSDRNVEKFVEEVKRRASCR